MQGTPCARFGWSDSAQPRLTQSYSDSSRAPGATKQGPWSSPLITITSLLESRRPTTVKINTAINGRFLLALLLGN